MANLLSIQTFLISISFIIQLLIMPVSSHGSSTMHLECRHSQDYLLEVKPSVRMGRKGDLSDIMVVVARLAGLSFSDFNS